MHESLLAFKQYYLRAAEKIPSDSFYYGSLQHKYRHSVAVWQKGRKIMQNTPELCDVDAKFKLQAERALLFHDVGRFNEAVLLYEANKNNRKVTAASNKFDHGKIGYELLKDDAVYGDMRILPAIKYHGKMIENVRDSDMWQKMQQEPWGKDAEKILYLVRDADKLANLDVIKTHNHLQEDLFFKQLTPKALRAPISKDVLAQFFAQKTILFTSVYSFSDRILMVLSWIFDLNYQYSKEVFIREGYLLYLTNLLAEYSQNAQDITEIKEFAERYWAV